MASRIIEIVIYDAHEVAGDQWQMDCEFLLVNPPTMPGKSVRLTLPVKIPFTATMAQFEAARASAYRAEAAKPEWGVTLPVPCLLLQFKNEA